MPVGHVQRRLAAILAADVAGYSRLMGADEEGTLAALTAHRTELIEPCIAEHRGRVVKTTGDGLLAEFASVVDAVRCAVAFQEGIVRRNADIPEECRIEFRIGVNLGDVIVQEDDIYGDGVNIAARLESLAEPGGICVSDMVHAGVRNKLALRFANLGERSLKNIAEAVRVFRIALDTSHEEGASATDALFRRPAVAVLPFQNLSGDPEQEYFADGLTEDIITALSLWKSFPVIARNSTFAYKGQSPDIRKVGAELGARYVIEGSVRRAADRVRINAQLINAPTGHHVWAERFDRRMADVFAVQDEITERIAGVVAPELSKAELRRSAAKRPDSLDAWECYVRGIAAVYEGTREGNARAHELLRRAVELDPGYGKAHVALSYLHNRDVRLEFTADPAQSARLSLDAARRAVALDDSDSDAYTKLARALNLNGQNEAALSAARKAVEINPFDAEARIILGSALTILGMSPKEGLERMKEGLALNPRDPRRYVWQTHMACAHLRMEQYEDAERLAREAMTERPDYVEARLVRASALGFLGRRDEARALYGQADRGEIAGIVDRRRIWGRPMKDVVLDGLRAAGMAE
ncbi:MAG TPA: adenylate/guanylate cyclase domain-containing protein [Gammaproteobacteria bacterium]